MAKTIEEILKDLQEWKEESPRSAVLLIAGLEDGSIIATVRGSKLDVINNIASAVVKNMCIAEAISQAFRIALEYANEEAEDN